MIDITRIGLHNQQNFIKLFIPFTKTEFILNGCLFKQMRKGLKFYAGNPAKTFCSKSGWMNSSATKKMKIFFLAFHSLHNTWMFVYLPICISVWRLRACLSVFSLSWSPSTKHKECEWARKFHFRDKVQWYVY